MTDQVSPLGTQDFSQYLTNIANSGAEFLINVNWGRDAVLSTQQAHQFGIIPKMTLVIPYQIPFLAKEVGPEIMGGVSPPPTSGGRSKTSIRWPRCSSKRSTRNTATGPNGAPRTPTCQIAMWARMVSEAGTFYPPDVIKPYEKGETFHSMVGPSISAPRIINWSVPSIIVRGKKPKR